MSAMFESYEREYSELSHSIARQAGLVASLSGGALPSPPPAPPRAAPRPLFAVAAGVPSRIRLAGTLGALARPSPPPRGTQATRLD